MIMKIPDDSNKSYNGHESSSPYMSDSSGNGDDVDPPTMDGDFSEYLWMEHEEEFDKQVMKELEEQELMQQCVQAMLEDEREIYNIHNQIASPPSSQQWSTATNCSPALVNNLPDLCQGVENLQVRDNLVKHSTLNPNAAEFVPRRRPTRLAGPASYLPKNS
ncbi:hypothetical protein R5R35_010927 [Gryllus longicercus]|uniref:Ataxin-2 C-terminal domain-containing protein n=1 Tax=Gryllus longicercus TaxID=2509291 RepID=A0AAN9V4H4_9ORTH